MKRATKTTYSFSASCLALILLSLAVTACKTTEGVPLTEQTIASTPFTTGVKDWLREYLSRDQKKAVSITNDWDDGASYYYNEFGYGSGQSLTGISKTYCENRSGQKCFVFALNNRIVWEDFQKYSPMPTPTTPFAGDSEFEHVRDVSICWRALVPISKSAGWESGSKFAAAVTEAKRRGLTPEKCALLTRRKT